MVDAVSETGLRMWLEHEEPVSDAQTDRRGLFSLLSGLGLAIGAALSCVLATCGHGSPLPISDLA